MKFSFHKMGSLPRLSWCAVMTEDVETIDVYIGPWVETRESFFVEGAWDGPFIEGGFDFGVASMASGGKLRENNVVFSTPYHIHERLHTLRINEKLYISPSLAFLLEKCGTCLDVNYIPYQVDLLKMINKMDNHIGSIPIDDGYIINVYHFRNIIVDSKLLITIENKNVTSDFLNYASYRNYLISKIKEIDRNANSPERIIRYSPISMMSTGYDSPACTVLGMEIGLADVVTFRKSREGRKEEDNNDSARGIAESLGLKVKEFRRSDVLEGEGTPEAEFVASGDLGQDFEISVLGEELQRKLVIVGYHGDTMWNVNKKNVSQDIPRGDAGGCCWTDFKFRIGYIFVPVPYIGCLSHPSILAISNSKEMEPWRMWNRYDRPIARRIVEERGVPRNMFGKNKKAISILLNTQSGLLSRMNKNSAVEFEKYYKVIKKKRSSLLQFYYNTLFYIYRIYYSVASRIETGLFRVGIQWNIPCPIPDKFTQCPRRPSYLVHWGISIIKQRYKTLIVL